MCKANLTIKVFLVFMLNKSFKEYCFIVLITSIYEENNVNKQKIKIGGLPKYTHY